MNAGDGAASVHHTSGNIVWPIAVFYAISAAGPYVKDAGRRRVPRLDYTRHVHHRMGASGGGVSEPEQVQKIVTSKDTNDPKGAKAPTDFFGSAFVVFGGALVSGAPSAAYGALTIGALFGVVAILDSIVAAILVVVRLRDWRAWVSLGLSALTVAASMLRSPHQIGP